jgi:hypothetical protein
MVNHTLSMSHVTETRLQLIQLRREFMGMVEACTPTTASSPHVEALLARVSTKLARVRNLLDIAREAPGKEQEAASLESGIYNVGITVRRGALALLEDAGWLSAQTTGQLREFAREQPEFFPDPRYRFTCDWFSSHIQQWQKDLGHLAGQSNLRFLEIGSAEGRSACWLIDNILTHESSHLTCVDPFAMPSGLLFDHNIGKSGAAHRVKRLDGYSGEVLRTLPLQSFDFIYVDGSHETRDALEDAVLSWRLLKDGALIIFDDYRWDEFDHTSLSHPKIGVDAFLAGYSGCYERIHDGYQLTLKKLR